VCIYFQLTGRPLPLAPCGQVLATSKDLKTSACTAAGRPHAKLLEIFKKIPTEVMEKFYGCGAPLPLGIDGGVARGSHAPQPRSFPARGASYTLPVVANDPSPLPVAATDPSPFRAPGLSVLDLGSGSGRDCYAAAALVGERGRVTGIDMTAEQLVTARKYNESFCKELGYKACNLEFVEGYIEKLSDAGIQADSYDLVISNCVVNLSPDKRSVLREVYKALKVGGEFYFSDVYCDRRLPKHVQVRCAASDRSAATGWAGVRS
jgi:arsenite methyltransferase